MNRKWILVLGIVCVLLVFGACASNPIIFDENLPLEESTHLYFYGGISIKEYNGIPVPQKTSISGMSSTWHDVYLPPGEMEFKLNAFFSGALANYRAEDVWFRYKFDAGRYYTLFFTPAGGPEYDIWGINIYDAPPPSAGYPRKVDLIAFTPFYKH